MPRARLGSGLIVALSLGAVRASPTHLASAAIGARAHSVPSARTLAGGETVARWELAIHAAEAREARADLSSALTATGARGRSDFAATVAEGAVDATPACVALAAVAVFGTHPMMRASIAGLGLALTAAEAVIALALVGRVTVPMTTTSPILLAHSSALGVRALLATPARLALACIGLGAHPMPPTRPLGGGFPCTCGLVADWSAISRSAGARLGLRAETMS